MTMEIIGSQEEKDFERENRYMGRMILFYFFLFIFIQGSLVFYAMMIS